MADDAQLREDAVGAAPEAESQGDVLSEEYQAQRLAERLGIEYLNLENFEIDAELFRSIPVKPSPARSQNRSKSIHSP